MIVCKVITNLDNCDPNYNIFDKLSDNGTFLLNTNTTSNRQEDVIYFASLKDEIDYKWVQKVFSKKGLSGYVHEYNNSKDLDFSLYCNQWVAIKLNEIKTIVIEREQQKELEKINRRIDLVEKVLDEIDKRQQIAGEKGILPEEAESIKKALRQ